jgi:hypothetical protein
MSQVVLYALTAIVVGGPKVQSHFMVCMVFAVSDGSWLLIDCSLTILVSSYGLKLQNESVCVALYLQIHFVSGNHHL